MGSLGEAEYGTDTKVANEGVCFSTMHVFSVLHIASFTDPSQEAQETFLHLSRTNMQSRARQAHDSSAPASIKPGRLWKDSSREGNFT